MLLFLGSECPPLTSPLNGQLEPLQSSYIFKDHITVTCDPGYSLRQVRQRLSLAFDDNGRLIPANWNRWCFRPHLSHNTRRLSQGDKEFEHYQIDCQRNGTWSNEIPLCKSKPYYNSTFFFSSYCLSRVISLFYFFVAGTREGISKESSFPSEYFNQSDTELNRTAMAGGQSLSTSNFNP